MKHFFLILLVSILVNASAQVDTRSNLSDKDKIYGLSKFWSEASYNFAYFDKTKINWDSAYQAFIPKVLATNNTWDYYIVLKQFCALLKDGHTGIFEPSSLYNNTSRYKWIVVEHLDHHFYVTNIGEVDKDKVPLGSELITVNNTPILDYVNKEMFPLISASTEHQRWNDAARFMFYATDTTQTWNLTLKTPSGKIVPYTAYYHTYRNQWVRSTPGWKRTEFKMINDIAYFQVGTFGDNKVIDDFKQILPELRKGKAVILDLRFNGGGSSSIGAEILKYFTDADLTGSVWQTREHLAAYKAWGSYNKEKNKYILSEFERKTIDVYNGNYWHRGDTMRFANNIKEPKIKTPLVVLIGNGTASAAEDFLIMLNGLPNRAIVMGQPSYGSTGQPLSFDMPGGGSARICTKKDTYPDGKEFVGVGVIPDIIVQRNINDMLAGKDAELEAAIKELNKKQLR
jgi:carboxyl-terminal processing protease